MEEKGGQARRGEGWALLIDGWRCLPRRWMTRRRWRRSGNERGGSGRGDGSASAAASDKSNATTPSAGGSAQAAAAAAARQPHEGAVAPGNGRWSRQTDLLRLKTTPPRPPAGRCFPARAYVTLEESSASQQAVSTRGRRLPMIQPRGDDTLPTSITCPRTDSAATAHGRAVRNCPTHGDTWRWQRAAEQRACRRRCQGWCRCRWSTREKIPRQH